MYLTCRTLTNHELHSSMANETNYFCPRCVIGHSCPIRRPTVGGKWNFGEINQHDDRGGRFSATFLDRSTEWVDVEEKPMSSYLAYHEDTSIYHGRSRLCTFLSKKKNVCMIGNTSKDDFEASFAHRERIEEVSGKWGTKSGHPCINLNYIVCAYRIAK